MTPLSQHPAVREAFRNLDTVSRGVDILGLTEVADAEEQVVSALLSALTPEDAVEAARLAMGRAEFCEDRNEGGHDYFRCVECARIAIRAAAPFLAAPLQQEIETLTAERDEARRKMLSDTEEFNDMRQSLATAEARVRELEKEGRQTRWWLWAAIRSVGGEVRISAKLADESPLDATIEREDDIATCERILRAKEAP